MSTYPAPIALFVYNRPGQTKSTVDALLKNELAASSDLVIFSDGPKSSADAHAVAEVRSFITGIKGFGSVVVHNHPSNRGLSRSLIDGISAVLRTHKRIIVLEDDLITSPFFLRYMNEALDMYADDARVASIHAYCYPVKRSLPETFFLRGADCWGWGTWRRAWNVFEEDAGVLLGEIRKRGLQRSFNWDGMYENVRMLQGVQEGNVDSWAIRWHASAFLKDMVTLYPGRSLIYNIGEGDSATNTHGLEKYRVELSPERVQVEKLETVENAMARKEVVEFFASVRPGILRRLAGGVYRRVLSTLRRTIG